MKADPLPARRGHSFGTLTLASLPKRFIDATRDWDPNLEQKETANENQR